MAYRSFVFVLVIASSCGGIAVIDEEDTTSSSTTNGTTTGGGNIQSIELAQGLFFASCQPVIPPDPLSADILLAFSNAGQTADVVIEGASLLGNPGNTFFGLSPQSFPVGPGESSVSLTKTPGSASGVPGCTWCNEIDVDLMISFTIDGAPRTMSDQIDSVSCSF